MPLSKETRVSGASLGTPRSQGTADSLGHKSDPSRALDLSISHPKDIFLDVPAKGILFIHLLSEAAESLWRAMGFRGRQIPPQGGSMAAD